MKEPTLPPGCMYPKCGCLDGFCQAPSAGVALPAKCPYAQEKCQRILDATAGVGGAPAVLAWGVFHPDGSAHIYQDRDTAKVFGEPIALVAAPGVQASEPTQREKDLALLVKRVCRRLQPDDMLREGATDYLRREGLLGTPLRSPDAGVSVGGEPSDTADEDAHVIDKLARLLAEIAVIVKGPELPLHRHGYHDLPALVAELKQRADGVALPAGLPDEIQSPEQGRFYALGWNDCAAAVERTLGHSVVDQINAALCARCCGK